MLDENITVSKSFEVTFNSTLVSQYASGDITVQATIDYNTPDTSTATLGGVLDDLAYGFVNFTSTGSFTISKTLKKSYTINRVNLYCTKANNSGSVVITSVKLDGEEIM